MMKARQSVVMKNLHQFKEYGSRRILTKSLKMNCRREGLGTLLQRSGRQEERTAGTRAADQTARVIPRLHDEAGSTSWLYEHTTCARRAGSTSARRALRGGSRKKYLGSLAPLGGLAPHMYRNTGLQMYYFEKWGGWARFGGTCAPLALA